MHKIKVAVFVNVAVIGLLAFMVIGCTSKKVGIGDEGLDGPTIVGEEIPNIYDDRGQMLDSGADAAAFDALYAPVQGLAFEPAYFTLDSYSLPPNEIAKIDLAGQDLIANANHVLIIEGHCDERGSNEYNLSLGENRALAIRSYLINMGVAPDRIQTRSFGEEKPAVMGMDESAWCMNRRGEFSLFQK